MIIKDGTQCSTADAWPVFQGGLIQRKSALILLLFFLVSATGLTRPMAIVLHFMIITTLIVFKDQEYQLQQIVIVNYNVV